MHSIQIVDIAAMAGHAAIDRPCARISVRYGDSAGMLKIVGIFRTHRENLSRGYSAGVRQAIAVPAKYDTRNMSVGFIPE